jgi:hypothetical protein
MNILHPDIIFGLFSDHTCLYLLTKLFFRENLNFSSPSYIAYNTVHQGSSLNLCYRKSVTKISVDCPFNYYSSFVFIVTNDSVNTTASVFL